ncbi:Electron-transferring-flavoprotein dehydrogenase [Ferroglobus placidus DSM 10642]|uniref:Electron-transferring-flavoprotein dehydrogenase n=1 Tax=Ferroglobus placidus (strain DSM 10642 / AEDII12DO) TaxID=589924 RepID=D3RZB7_FERPA|nr:FAD-dependent oxidoreductase [Ferroglobus placidus]ADC65830.1 Electron-transferring-flavoprotein dehydrogenase [Ferroglobus placidus DSM 10642]
MEEKFDAVVVGGGASGLGAAIKLAKYGFNVVLLERGERIGSKSVYGGRIYSEVFKRELGSLDDAPVERWVRKEVLTFLDSERGLSIELFAKKNEESFTAYLSNFNSWLAQIAENEGALVIAGMKVDDLIIEDGKVKGVVAGGEKLYSDVVIDAEGVNPILAMRAGIRRDWKPNEVAVGVKEVVKLSEEEINKRFGLESDEGLANLMVGFPNSIGGAFLYTNKETVSLGVVVRVDSAVKNNLDVYELAEDIRLHPYVYRLVKGGSVIEYSAHLVPEAGVRGVPERLVSDGFVLVGDAAGLVLNRGFTVRGVDYAFYSGVLAAEAVKNAHEKGEMSRENLAVYESLLKSSAIYEELKFYEKAHEILGEEKFYSLYPQMFIEVFEELYRMDKPKTVYSVVKEKMRERVSTFRAFMDFWKVVRSL